MRMEDPEGGALKYVRALQQWALEVGHFRVELQTRIAEMERDQNSLHK